jgi:hypothetical protein
MKKINELKQLRADKIKRMSEIVEFAEKENRSRNEDEST